VQIRPATQKDSKTIAYFLFIAMENIVYQFIKIEDKEQALNFLYHFTAKTTNQYSWQNCFIGEINDEVIAVANVYNGANLQLLRQPIIEFIRSNFNPTFDPESETQAGEMYLDCFAVDSNYRGQGFGSKLLEFLIEEFVGKKSQVFGLLVEKENFNAKKLYKKTGFKFVNDQLLMGKVLEHWQVQL
jgi:ribosomal protein S18 acetylase RimI-like enzyme